MSEKTCFTPEYENLISWLSEIIANEHAGGRLEGIPALLEYAEVRLPDREYAILEALVGF